MKPSSSAPEAHALLALIIQCNQFDFGAAQINADSHHAILCTPKLRAMALKSQVSLRFFRKLHRAIPECR